MENLLMPLVYFAGNMVALTGFLVYQAARRH